MLRLCPLTSISRINALQRAITTSKCALHVSDASPSQRGLFSSTASPPCPRVGDALVFNRYIYYHSAVYVGRGDMLLERARRAKEEASTRAAAGVKQEELLPNCHYTLADAYEAIQRDTVINPTKHYLMHYVPPSGWYLMDKLRHGLSRSFNVEFTEFDSVRRGSNMFVASRPWGRGSTSPQDGAKITSFPPNSSADLLPSLTSAQEQKLALVVRHYDSQLGGYDFFFNNCQHFATYVAFGKGAIYMWTLGQMAIGCVLVMAISVSLLLRLRRSEELPEDRAAQYSYLTDSERRKLCAWVICLTVLIMGSVASRHGMYIRLSRAIDP